MQLSSSAKPMILCMLPWPASLGLCWSPSLLPKLQGPPAGLFGTCPEGQVVDKHRVLLVESIACPSCRGTPDDGLTGTARTPGRLGSPAQDEVGGNGEGGRERAKLGETRTRRASSLLYLA